MKIQIRFLFFISAVNLVTSGYLTGHHPIPPNLITSRTIIGSAVGGNPSSGAYSSSQLTQSISTSPHQIQSSTSTYHPSNYDLNSYQSGNNHLGRYNANPTRYFSQFTPNRLYNPNQSNHYITNHPSALAYGSNDNQRQGNYNQDQGAYYQSQNNGYNRQSPDHHNSYGEY